MKLGSAVKKAIAASLILNLVGCATGPQTPRIELPAPDAVPKEQWSDAMHVITAMGITGQRDIPQQYANPANQQEAASTSVNAADAALAASSGAGGLGLGLFLLGGASDPARAYQVAAFVPTTLAASPEEASKLALKVMEETRLQVFPAKRSKLSFLVGQYPSGHPKAFDGASALLNDRPAPFTSEASNSPAFLNYEKVYGPIFFHNEQFTIDANKNDLTTVEAMTRMSKALPDWFYIYHPGQALRVNSVPARVINKGEAMFFIAK